MLDMSFSEIAVIGVVALVVLGPERLPKVARTAGHLFGRLQRYVATVKADINREMDTSELAKIKQEIQDAAKGFEQTVQQHASVVEKETAAISQAIDPQTPASAIAAASTPTQSVNRFSACPGDLGSSRPDRPDRLSVCDTAIARLPATCGRDRR